MGLAAGLHFEHGARGVLQIEHGIPPQLPIEIPRVRIVRVLDPDGPAVRQGVIDLRADFGVGQVGKEGECALGDFHGGLYDAVAVGTKSAVSVDV